MNEFNDELISFIRIDVLVQEGKRSNRSPYANYRQWTPAKNQRGVEV